MSDRHAASETLRPADALALDRCTGRSVGEGRWFVLEGLLAPRVAAELFETCPVSDLTRVRNAPTSDKEYAFSMRTLVRRGRPEPFTADLAPAWSTVLRGLLGPGYSEYMTRLTGRDAAPELLDVSIVAYGAGDWISSHTDKPGKHWTHVVFLNERWLPEWGGSLQLLDRDQRRVIEDVRPTAPTSAVIRRSDESWHQVTPVQSIAPTARVTLQIENWCA